MSDVDAFCQDCRPASLSFVRREYNCTHMNTILYTYGVYTLVDLGGGLKSSSELQLYHFYEAASTFQKRKRKQRLGGEYAHPHDKNIQNRSVLICDK